MMYKPLRAFACNGLFGYCYNKSKKILSYVMNTNFFTVLNRLDHEKLHAESRYLG